MPPALAVCPSIDLARRVDTHRRVPLLVEGTVVGSVRRDHLPLLARHAPWLLIDDHGVSFAAALSTPEARTEALARSNLALREAGLIAGWRDEVYTVQVDPDSPVLACLERAAARFWGTLTFGAHLNGHVCDAQGRITALWIAQRSLNKATDPGRLDNLVGGGIAHGQTPFDALVRECWEESGLDAVLARQARPGRRIRLLRDVAEGLQHEILFSYDLRLPEGLQPRNIDGEVMAHRLVPVDEVIELLKGEAMTVDAALVTLDFLLRHDLLPAGLADAWARAAGEAGLFGPPSPIHQDLQNSNSVSPRPKLV